MPSSKKSPKRSVRTTVWGNARAYLGTKCVWDFGCDALTAAEWVRDGHWIVFGQNGDCLRSITAPFESKDSPPPAGYKWVNPLPQNES